MMRVCLLVELACKLTQHHHGALPSTHISMMSTFQLTILMAITSVDRGAGALSIPLTGIESQLSHLQQDLASSVEWMLQGAGGSIQDTSMSSP